MLRSQLIHAVVNCGQLTEAELESVLPGPYIKPRYWLNSASWAAYTPYSDDRARMGLMTQQITPHWISLDLAVRRGSESWHKNPYASPEADPC